MSSRLRWLPRVFTNNLAIERELEKETSLIYLTVFLYRFTSMDTVEIRLIFLVVNFWIKATTMAISQLMTGKHIPHFGLNSLISTLPFGEIFSCFATSWKRYCLTKKSRLFRRFFQYSVICHFSKYSRLALTDFHKNKVCYRKYMWLQLCQVLKKFTEGNARKFTVSFLLFAFMLMS